MDNKPVSGRGSKTRPHSQPGRFFPALAAIFLAAALLAGSACLGAAPLMAAAGDAEENPGGDGFKRLTGPIFDVIKGEEAEEAASEGAATEEKAPEAADEKASEPSEAVA